MKQNKRKIKIFFNSYYLMFRYFFPLFSFMQNFGQKSENLAKNKILTQFFISLIPSCGGDLQNILTAFSTVWSRFGRR